MKQKDIIKAIEVLNKTVEINKTGIFIDTYLAEAANAKIKVLMNLILNNKY